jgi:hypothetical protein
MQIQIYTIPILGGEALNDELNRFLRSKNVLQVESQLVSDGQNAFWCFCIKYIEEKGADRGKKRVDYREVLDDDSFKRFSRMSCLPILSCCEIISGGWLRESV